MGFISFLGRVVFASIFILSAWQMFNEFGLDGGPAAKELAPKLAERKEILSLKLGMKLPDIDARRLVATSMVLKGLGGILFVFGSSFGAYLLLIYLAYASLLYDYHNYDWSHPEFFQLADELFQTAALFGALLFFLGMKNSFPRRQLKKKAPKAKSN